MIITNLPNQFKSLVQLENRNRWFKLQKKPKFMEYYSNFIITYAENVFRLWTKFNGLQCTQRPQSKPNAVQKAKEKKSVNDVNKTQSNKK